MKHVKKKVIRNKIDDDFIGDYMTFYIWQRPFIGDIFFFSLSPRV